MPKFTVRYGIHEGPNTRVRSLTVECSYEFAAQRALSAAMEAARGRDVSMYDVVRYDPQGGRYELVIDHIIVSTGTLHGLLDEARGCAGASIYRRGAVDPLITRAGSDTAMVFHRRDGRKVTITRPTRGRWEAAA